MFGLVNIYRDELKVKNYDLFRAYYCGLCKALGKRYNQLVRLGLSYDMTFLAILADSLSEDSPDIISDGCIKHIGRHKICTSNRAIDFSADMSIILTYHKLTDDISDERSLKAFFARLPYFRAFKKASNKYPSASQKIKKHLDELLKLEKSKCASIDEAADPFANLTSTMFGQYDASLTGIGYNIGRFIYIADAYGDIEYDIKHKQYNPYLCRYNTDFVKTEEFRKSVMGSLNMTLFAVSESYSELKIKKNKEILDNIIYLGLRSAYDTLFKNTEEING